MPGTKISQTELINPFRFCRWRKKAWRQIENTEWITPVDEMIMHLLSLRLNSHVIFSMEWQNILCSMFNTEHRPLTSQLFEFKCISKFIFRFLNLSKSCHSLLMPLLWNVCKRIDKTTKITIMNNVLCHANRVKWMNICNGMCSVCQLWGHSHNAKLMRKMKIFKCKQFLKVPNSTFPFLRTHRFGYSIVLMIFC